MTYRSPRPLKRILFASFLVACSTPSQAASLSWNLAGGGTWDTTTANWTTGIGTTTFTDGVDDVAFNNSAGGTITVLASGLSPVGITINATAGTYTFSGGAIGGTGGLTKSGAGSFTISNTNSYTGATTINGPGSGTTGFLSITTALQNGGVNSAIGASSSAASNLVITGSTAAGVDQTGLLINAVSTTDRLFTIGANATVRANQATSFTNTGAIAYVTPNTASALVLSSSNTAFNFSPQITNNGTGIVTLRVSGGGTTNANAFVLSSTTSNYTGSTTFTVGNGSIIEIKKLSNGGSASSIGASTSADTNWVMNGGTILRYTGSGDSTDRNYNVTGNGNKTITFDSSGTGALAMGGVGTYVNAGNATTVTLAGTSAGNLTNAYNGLLSIAGTQSSAVVSLIKSGSNTWSLGNANTYLGMTSVNAGTLLINGNQIAATGAVTVAGGATLGGNGIVGGATTVSTTGILAPGNTVGLLTFANNLTLGGVDAKINFDIASGARGVNFDAVNVTGALAYNGDLTLGMAAAIANGTYNLFTFGSQSGNLDTVAFAGTSPYSGSFTNNAGVWSATANGQSFTFTQSTGDLMVAAVPEPATVVSALVYCGILLLRRKMKSSDRKQG